MHSAYYEHRHPDSHLLSQRTCGCGCRPNRITTQCPMPLSLPIILVRTRLYSYASGILHHAMKVLLYNHIHTYIHTYIHIIADIGRMSSIC